MSSHSYSSYRHSGRSGSYGSRSTSTGTPPQTPTIRVTSPVPDAIGVIDIWDPEIIEDDIPESRSPSPSKTYSFRYREDGSSTSSSTKNKKTDVAPPPTQTAVGIKKDFADSSMQVDLTQVMEDSTSIGTMTKLLLDDDGLKTAGGSEESSECEEISQISAVTQVFASTSNRHEPSPETDIDKDECECCDQEDEDEEEKVPLLIASDQRPEEKHSTVTKETLSKWNESLPSSRPIKTIQYGRSLSLFSSSPSSPALVFNDQSGSKVKKQRRYSNMECAVVSSLETLLAEGQAKVSSHGGKMLSPTPESAFEAVQSPQTEEEGAGARVDSQQPGAIVIAPTIREEDGGCADDDVDRESGLMTDEPGTVRYLS